MRHDAGEAVTGQTTRDLIIYNFKKCMILSKLNVNPHIPCIESPYNLAKCS
jgi:hypothetical protein